ncbi:hypothetical protein [Parabacteroides merdae]|uniref:hypothetical protein n=1 Tax=Parabacteroides merdae TaxID=46503 RepID=UPI0034A49029
MAETAREGKAREPLSGTVSGQPDKILHGNPAQAAGRGFLHGIHRLYRRESHKGREQGGSGQPAAGLLRGAGKAASPGRGTAGETTGGDLQVHAQMRRGNRRKPGPAQTGRLPAGAREGDKPYRPQRDGTFARLPELRGL